jgi:quinol monooxygenase YgiN
MTILIAGTVDFPDGKREQALADSAQLVVDTRSQRGCRHYVWSADPTSHTRVYVYECWESTEDLAAHLAGSYYAQMLAVLGSFGAENADVAKFKVALEEPVYDPEGTPRADFFTA